MRALIHGIDMCRPQPVRHHVERLEKDVACKANLPSDSTMAKGASTPTAPEICPCPRAALSTCGLQ